MVGDVLRGFDGFACFPLSFVSTTSVLRSAATTSPRVCVCDRASVYDVAGPSDMMERRCLGGRLKKSTLNDSDDELYRYLSKNLRNVKENL